MKNMYERKKWFIPYSKLTYSEEMIDAAVRVLRMGALTTSDEGHEFIMLEKEFANAYGKKYGICLASGTASLHLAALACGIGQGDEVIIAPNTTCPVGDITFMVGAKPVFVEPEYDTLNIDATKIEAAITPKTKAIIPVHMQGHPCDMDPILEIAEKHDLRIISNPTHAAEAKYKGQKVPVKGVDVAVYGFHHMKSLYLTDGGGGGMVLTDDKEIAQDVRDRRYHGRDFSKGVYDHPILGYNYRMSDLSAAIGRIQLRELPMHTKHQREIAYYYNELLEDTPVTLPAERDYAYHTYLRYVIWAPKRDQLMAYLAKQGINSSVIYSIPMHLQSRFMKLLGTQKGDFPITEKIKETELGLPVPKFREKWEVEFVCEQIKEFYSSSAF